MDPEEEVLMRKCKVARAAFRAHDARERGIADAIADLHAAIQSLGEFNLDKEINTVQDVIKTFEKKSQDLEAEENKVHDRFRKEFGKDEEFWEDVDAKCEKFEWWWE